MTEAVVAHDAGGAEILSSYVRQQGLDCVYVLDGPARAVFARKLGAVDRRPLDEAIARADRVLCGTSWQSDLELTAIRRARAVNKPSIAFLDHWINYRERFERRGTLLLPDEIWVGDEFAYRLARRVFPAAPVTLVDNPYFSDMRAQIAALPARRERGGAIAVAYLCEPIREHALRQHGDEYYWGYVEEDALRYFLAHTAALGRPVERIVVRPHPSEPPGKYEWVGRECPLSIAVGGARTLLEDIADCDVVVGCESTAMVVALMAGKRVISAVPPAGRPCPLPYDGIESLQALVAALDSVR